MGASESQASESGFLAGAAIDLKAPDGPQLIGSECTQCHHKLFPPAEVCPSCLSEALAPLRLSREGTLYSYSVVHMAPRGWLVPYVVGYVDLPEGVRVFGHVAADPASLRPDGKVRVSVGPVRRDERGEDVLSYRFEPAE